MSPERAISPQYETAGTPKMSVPGSPIAGTPVQDARSPMSLLLAVAQSQSKNPDDDLTSLSWLHDRDLLKGMNIDQSPSNSVSPLKPTIIIQRSSPAPVEYTEDSHTLDTTNSSISSQLSTPPLNFTDIVTMNNRIMTMNNINVVNTNPSPSQRNRHPHNIPYDPQVHTNNKPPYSFSCLIFMAIEDSARKALPVKEIYAWILDHFPYFKHAPTGWKNSVRHNLSLNKCFQKVEKAPNFGKGSLWTVDQQYKPNLIQALTRSPFHPCSTLDTSNFLAKIKSEMQTDTDTSSPNKRLPNPELFPYLSKKLASSIKVEASDSLDEADAAAAMLSLKNGPGVAGSKWQIITTSPSQDHTYSTAEVSQDGSTEENRVLKSKTCRKIDFEDDEERKIKEGAETLLNLAGIRTRKRFNSQSSQTQESYKAMRLSTLDINENDSEKQTPFKPRLLLRTKSKTTPNKIVNNNNEDEWVKHRREMDIEQNR